jgi:CHAT domain-containing protein/tetratricopeptide (TPR) repeat protein
MLNNHAAHGLVVWFVASAVAVLAQTSGSAPQQRPPSGAASGLRKLTGADAKQANTLRKAIIAAEKAGRWPEAIAAAEQALALRTRVQGADHYLTIDADWKVKTLRRLEAMSAEERASFKLGSDTDKRIAALYEQKEFADAQPLLEKSLQITRRLFGDNHPDTAASYNNLGTNLEIRRKYAAAQPILEKALEIRRRVYSADHPLTAGACSKLALNYSAQAKHEAAQALYEQALAIHRHLAGDGQLKTAESYNLLAANLDAQGKYAEARPLHEKGLAIRRRLFGDDSAEAAVAYTNLATNLKLRGRFAEAQPLCEKVLAIARQRNGEDHPETAEAYVHLAANLDAQGRYAAAQPLLERALAIRLSLYNDNNISTAVCYNNLAMNLRFQGKYNPAHPLLTRSLAIHRNLQTDNHPDTAGCYASLASNCDAIGDYRSAEQHFQKALEIDTRILGGEHVDVARINRDFAVCLMHQGKYQAAQRELEKALAIYRRQLTETHLATAALYEKLASCLNAQGQYALARDQWLSAARSVEGARVLAAFSGMERASATTAGQQAEALAAVMARLGQPGEAFRQLEENLGRGLLDELAAREDRSLTPDERARMTKLVANLDRLDRLFEAPLARPTSKAEIAKIEELRRERERAQFALGALRAELAAKHGPIAGKAAALGEIQAALPDDAALVAWIDRLPPGPNAADPGGEHWGVVVRPRDKPAWVRLPGTGRDHAWTDDNSRLPGAVRNAIIQPPQPNVPVQPLLPKLRAQRLLPLSAALGETGEGLPAARRLIVLPSRAMVGVPIETLLEPTDPWIVSYAPSATVLAYLRHRPHAEKTGGLLALGDPIFDRRDARLSGGAAPANPAEFGRLPGTRVEIEALARLFQAGHQPCQLLSDTEASEPTLAEMASSGTLGRFAYIHLATHGLIDDGVPEQSSVILTLTNLPNPLTQVLNHQPVYDGRLSVREIQRGWDLHSELVTLSACETALGREAGGEGFVGFSQALLMSGARSICLSLWRVDDTATALLMHRFYSNLLGARSGLVHPMPKAEALAEAKGWLRALSRDELVSAAATISAGEARSKGAAKRQPPVPALQPPSRSGDERPYAHPFYWAAFVLVGDPD